MLKGKAAIVTGGSRGIGFAISKELTEKGAEVIICSRNQDQLSETVSKLSTSLKPVFGIVADVSKFEDCQKLIQFAYSKWKRIDILVNNAGIFGPIGLLETNEPKSWEEVLAINVLGAVYCSKLAIPYMKNLGSGKIINLAGAGVGGPHAHPRFSGYYTSKAAIVSFTETLAEELKEDNIQVNAIAPGAIATQLQFDLLKMDKSLVGEKMYQTAQQLLEQDGLPLKMVAKLAAFLAEEDANHITGRLLSAKWDSIEELAKVKRFTQNQYRLRRIDNRKFFEKNDS